MIWRQIFIAWLRGEAKNNQCHGMVALVRMASFGICVGGALCRANQVIEKLMIFAKFTKRLTTKFETSAKKCEID